MLFSDGGTEQAWEVLEKYNPDKEIRIFSYAIGPHPVPYATLKEIACANRGYFTAIQAYGQIRTKIQDYVKVLSRPLILSGEKHFEWTNFYIDAMGLGMMTTITLPVFNRTETGNQTMVGIMGVDVSLQEFLEYEPSYEMGPVAYSFGINHNGYVVFYPDLKTEFEFTEDPLPIDFLDIEIENSAKEELREAMINLETSKRSLTSLLKMPDREHVVRHHMEYYYTPVNKTSFSIAIVIPTDRTHYLVAEEPDVSESLNLLDFQMLGMHIAPWKYCHGAILKMTTPEIMSNLSKSSRENPKQCKIQLLQRLAWDIRKTEDIIDYWQSEQQEGKRKGVVATFVQTESGLTRIYPPSEVHYLGNQTNPSRSLIFQRAFYGDDYVFLPPKDEYDPVSNESEAVITVVKSISFVRHGISYKPAVVGVMVDPLWLQPYLLSTPTGPGKVPVSCSDTDYIVCYLIDDGGFIISTNQDDLWNVLGKFLGAADPQIMSELSERKIFVRNEDYTSERQCRNEVKTNAGFRVTTFPLHSTLSAFNFGWLFDIAAWSQLKYWLLSFLQLLKIPKTEAAPKFYEVSNNTVCTTREVQYYWGRWGRSYSGDMFCINCTRQYSLAKVGQMNALLLVTSKPCDPNLCEPNYPLLKAKEEVVGIGYNPCNSPLRYRRRPEKCYYYSPSENNSECVAVGTPLLPHLVLVIELLSAVFIAQIIFTSEK
ncbi:voltage-dependent calcium channel subunit alpha-2/delta-1-like [Stegodyphus dumicola]|uniref:voltage-dependent calcium channel subunit alpha-2/delta-1-like n=1 Tax=Stegodyphus dumicola TaxID=202533 RepID=UPI0015A84505|nr:voltage-dependent calcium channel subunit alpha-2/delta-1-like [Stegodyphus dumicola]